MRKLLFGILLAPMAFGTNIARADGWPASVVGTWSVLANQSAGTLFISRQGSTGSCRSIVGTILGTNSIGGFYCPFSGRIHFLRKLGGTNTTFQAYTGNLSQAGAKLHMGGVFSDVVDSLGEYNFEATK